MTDARSQSTRKWTPGQTHVRIQGEFGSSNTGPVLDSSSEPGPGPVNRVSNLRDQNPPLVKAWIPSARAGSVVSSLPDADSVPI